MNLNNLMPPCAIRHITPEEVYTDRTELLEYLHQYALKAITCRVMSTVLLGQRRMGKTEIFKRVVNRLPNVLWSNREDLKALLSSEGCFSYVSFS